MAGRRRLRRGLARCLPNHSSALGKQLRVMYDDLRASLAVGDERVLQDEVSRVAVLKLRSHLATEALLAAVEKRRAGRGRVPAPRQLERLRRVAALEDGTFSTALERLRARVGERPRTDAEIESDIARRVLAVPPVEDQP